MDAIILTGGLGTRLRPLTDRIPKCLVPLSGRPLLGMQFDHLKRAGIHSVYLNAHHFAEQIHTYITDYQSVQPDMAIAIRDEAELLGSAGTVKAIVAECSTAAPLLIVYGDVLNTVDYQGLIDSHVTSGADITIVCTRVDSVEGKGIVEVDSEGRVLAFKEKPKPHETDSCLANSGVYVLGTRFLSALKAFDKTPLDFGYDVFPTLLKEGLNFHTFVHEGFLIDIGTPESYSAAEQFLLDNPVFFN